ncbi:hypothetical protein VTK56DRAFT_7310 [Thermocarpiscus australiensis]
MVGSALAISLIGLGAVQALPAGKPVEERQGGMSIGDGTGIFTPGGGEPPACLTDIPLNEQPPCLLPPIVGGLEPSGKREEKSTSNPKRQIWIGDGTGTFTPGGGEPPTCLTNIPLNEQPPCLLPPIVGGLKPPKKGKRFTLLTDYATNTKKVIEELEADLIKLQNKQNKTPEDVEEIKAIKAALLYLAGITNISAPPGTGSTFTPGKRDVDSSLDAVGTYASVCADLESAEIALETLMHKDKPTSEERIIMQELEAFLKGCGITIVKSPDGTITIIKPSDKKREVAGWTTPVPGNTIPGGPLVPDPTIPGGPLIPDPTVPGGPIKPSDKKRRGWREWRSRIRRRFWLR